MKEKSIATIYAILAAALYAINVPMSKILLNYVELTMMASFLYFGVGVGLFLYGLIEKIIGKSKRKEPLTKKRIAIYCSNGCIRYSSSDFIDVRHYYDEFCKCILDE